MTSLKDENEISLKELTLKLHDWISFLISKWRVMIIVGFLGGSIGLAYAWLKKPLYVARLTFVLEEDSGGKSPYAGLASQFGIDLGGGGGGGIFSGGNIMELIKSRAMTERSLLSEVNLRGERESLANYYIHLNKLRERWENKPELFHITYPVGLDRSMFSRVQDSLLQTFSSGLQKNTIQVKKPNPELDIIELTCKSSDETFSKTLTDILIKQVSEFYIQTKTERSVQGVNILQSKADSLHTALEKAMYGRAATIDQILNINPSKQIAAVPSQRQNVDIQIISAAYSEIVKNLEIAKMTLMKEKPLIQIIDTPIFPLKKEQPGKIKGLIIGGGLSIFVTVLWFSLKRLYLSLLEEKNN